MPKGTSGQQQFLPFKSLKEWLNWKRDHLECMSDDADDETAYDHLFSGPESSFGIGGIFEFEASDRSEELTATIGSPVDLGCTQNEKLFYEKLGASIAFVQLFGGKIDVDRLGMRIDPRKHMMVDAVSLLLRKLDVQKSSNGFVDKWREVRDKLLVEGTQLGDAVGRRGEDRGATAFLVLTYWLFRKFTRLPEKRIRYFQKMIMTQFLLGDGVQLEPPPCRYCLDKDVWNLTRPIYEDGKLVEKEKAFAWDESGAWHPGRSVGRAEDSTSYVCPKRKRTSRKGTSHCMNGNVCWFVDRKVESWHRLARKIGLLKKPPSNFDAWIS